MIDSLHGEVLRVGLDHVVIECGGVGYRAVAAPPLLSRLRSGETVRVLTTLIVREDSQTLYAFDTADNREMFDILQTVSGVGPRVAMAMLAVFPAEQIAAAIMAGDAKTLQKAPGVGKRMAERMIVDLKNKVGAYAPAAGGTAASAVSAGDGSVSAGGPLVEKVTQALVGLGFTEAQAEKAAAGAAAAGATSESEMLRAALAAMSR